MSAAPAGAAAISATTPAAVRGRPAAARLRDDNDIPGLQLYVLLEVLAVAHLAVVKAQGALAADGVADHDDTVQLRVGVTAAGDTQRLQDVHGRVHDDGTGLGDLADHVEIGRAH